MVLLDAFLIPVSYTHLDVYKRQAVDVSQAAMDAVARNAKLNGVSIQCVTDNAFDFLKKEAALVRDGWEHKWDLISLDPPSFTRNKKSVQDVDKRQAFLLLRRKWPIPHPSCTRP